MAGKAAHTSREMPAKMSFLRMAGLGSSQHAVERHAALPRRGGSKWCNQQARANRRRSDGIDLPTGMVARRRADRARVRSLRLVESLFVRSRNASDAVAGADGGGVWIAAMVAWHVDLRFRRTGADRLHLFPRGARLPRGVGSGE